MDEGVLGAVLEHCMCVCVWRFNEGEAIGDHLALADTHLLNQQQGETGRSAEIMACTASAYTRACAHTHTHTFTLITAGEHGRVPGFEDRQ